MTSSPGPGWWLATDGSWYPPEAHPDVASRPRATAAAGARVSGPARRPSLRPYLTTDTAPSNSERGTATATLVEPTLVAPPAETPPLAAPIAAPPPTAPPVTIPQLAAETALDVGANDLIPLDGAFDDLAAAPEPPTLPLAERTPTAPSAIDELLAAVDTSTAASTPEIVDVADTDLIPLEAPDVADAPPPLQQELDPTAALSRFTPAPEPAPARAYVAPEEPLDHDPAVKRGAAWDGIILH